MPAASRPRKAVAVSKKAAKDLDLLGHVAMYTLPDEPVKGTALIRAWKDADLDPDVIPRQRTGAHIFQSACRSVESKKGHNGHTGVEVKVDEVPTPGDASECVYQITRIVRDGDRRLIEHPKGMTLRYDAGTDEITVESEFEEYEALRSLEEDIRKHFKRNQKTTPGQKVRNAVRDTLRNLGATNLRGKAGGVYFVPAKGPQGNDTEPVLRGLAQALSTLYGERGDLYTIPLISEQESRNMVAKHFAMNIAADSAEVMEEAMQRVRKGKSGGRGPRKDMLANLHNKRRQLNASVKQYRELVTLDESAIKANLEDLDRALDALQDLADKTSDDE